MPEFAKCFTEVRSAFRKIAIFPRYQQPTEKDLQDLSRAIGKNVTIVLKGNIDLIAGMFLSAFYIDPILIFKISPITPY